MTQYVVAVIWDERDRAHLVRCEVLEGIEAELADLDDGQEFVDTLTRWPCTCDACRSGAACG